MEPEVIEEEVSLFEDGGKPREEVAEVEPVKDTAPAFEIPEKFKDKSMEDVIQSYVNLEKEYGNKSNEVGELRKLTDQILLNQVQTKPQSKTDWAEDDINDEVGFDDFIENPQQALDRALSHNPRLAKLEKELEANAAEQSRKALLARHSDADEVVVSPDFQKWVQESPGRLRMLQEAHVNRDVAIASDLLDTYKTTRRAATEAAVDERDAIAAGDLKKAKVEKGGVPVNTKKVYRRAELIQLKIQNPAAYEARSEEFKRAYAEGRVK